MTEAQTDRVTDLTALRRRVGVLLGDYKLWKATADGDTTSLVDDDHIIYADYNGQLLYFSSGANTGKMRKVQSTDLANSKVLWQHPLPSPTKRLDEVEVWNRAGQSWSPDEVNEAVREAHRRALEHFPIRIEEEVDIGSDGTMIEIPEEFWAITAVDWLDHFGNWTPFSPAPRYGHQGYWVMRGQRKIVLNHPNPWAFTGSKARLRGWLRENELTHDASQTRIHSEWIVIEAARILLGAAKGRFPGDREIESRYRDFENETRAKRVLIRARREPVVHMVL
jgi:hypothetical protein